MAYHESGSSLPFDWRNHFFDYEKCLRLINEHLELSEIVDRRLEVSDLKEHLLIDSGEIDALLLRQCTKGAKQISETVKNPSKPRRKSPPQSGDQRNRIL
jgi:hypothetical protein